MKHEELIAIDIHTHAEVSCWNPFDSYGEEYDRAADKYFRNSRRPTPNMIASVSSTIAIPAASGPSSRSLLQTAFANPPCNSANARAKDEYPIRPHD